MREDGVRIALVSGGIDFFLKKLWPACTEIFDRCYWNELLFAKDGWLRDVIPTKYDFQGKRLAVEQMQMEFGVAKERTLFLGKGFNDEYVVSSVGRAVTFASAPQGTRELFHARISDSDFSAILDHVYMR